MRLIDADALRSFIAEQVPPKFFLGSDISRAYKNTEAIIHSIEIQPTIDPVKHGHWIRKKPTPDTERYICSGCFVTGKYRVWLGVDGLNYCPCCGAKNDKVVTE